MGRVKATHELPRNIDAEKAVLGAMMLNKDAMYTALSLHKDDFYDLKHQLIFEAIASLQSRGTIVDTLTVAEELESMKELENIGGASYLGELTNSVIAVNRTQFYVDSVNDQATLRKMLLTIRDIDREYREEDIDNPNDFILKCEQRFATSVSQRTVSGFQEAKVVAERIEKQIESIQGTSKGDSDMIGLDTGYKKINELTQGFKKGEMIVVAARPSVGKTSLATNFAYNIAKEGKHSVAIFSCEMAADQIAMRLIASDAFVPIKSIASGKFAGDQRRKVAAAIENVSKSKIFIDDTSNIPVMEIVAKSRKLQAAHPDLSLIVVDYLGLVELSGSDPKHPDSRTEAVRKISATLKGLAKEMGIPIIIVSQLNRSSEQRGENKRPMLSDLRDSGAVEQDADIVMLLYRDDYYGETKKVSAENKKAGQLTNADKFELLKKKKEQELGEAMPGNASFVEVNIAKNRNGQTGKANLFFYKDFNKFDNPTEEWEREMAELAKMSEE